MGRNKMKWLMDHGCKIETRRYGEMEDKVAVTGNGDYVTLIGLKKDMLGDFIYKHRLSNLMSIHTARGDGQKGCTVGVGFNETEQRWYGWTHRAYKSYGVGDKISEGSCLLEFGYKAGQELKTLEECKNCAICTSEYFD